jgi:hypothetical protein
MAIDIGTKASHVESQLKRRIAILLAKCDAPSPPKRVRKRDVGKPQPATRKDVNVPMDVENVVTQADFAAIKALAGLTTDDADQVDDAGEDAKTKRKSAPWTKPCADARDAMLAEASRLDAGTPLEARDAVLTAAARGVLKGHGFNPAQAAIVADVCLRAFQSYTCPEFGRVGPQGTDGFVHKLELDARGYADMALRNNPQAFRERVTGEMDKAWTAKEKVFACEVGLLDLRNRRKTPMPVLDVPVAIRRSVWDSATMGERLKATKPSRMPSIRNIALELGPD